MSQATETRLIELTKELLTSIGERNWKRYAELCDPSLTCFEPETLGRLVEGLEFHRYYFELDGAHDRRNTTLASPHVRLIGNDAAVVSYVRLTQKLDGGGQPVTVAQEETRVWQRSGGEWKHVHFHRSAVD